LHSCGIFADSAAGTKLIQMRNIKQNKHLNTGTFAGGIAKECVLGLIMVWCLPLSYHTNN
jgi:hypothetical protein